MVSFLCRPLIITRNCWRVRSPVELSRKQNRKKCQMVSTVYQFLAWYFSFTKFWKLQRYILFCRSPLRSVSGTRRVLASLLLKRRPRVPGEQVKGQERNKPMSVWTSELFTRQDNSISHTNARLPRSVSRAALPCSVGSSLRGIAMETIETWSPGARYYMCVCVYVRVVACPLSHNAQLSVQLPAWQTGRVCLNTQCVWVRSVSLDFQPVNKTPSDILDLFHFGRRVSLYNLRWFPFFRSSCPPFISLASDLISTYHTSDKVEPCARVYVCNTKCQL